MWVDGREHQRLGAVGAIFLASQWNRGDVLHLPRCPVILGDFGSASTIDNIGIKRVGSDVAVFDHADRVPVAEGDDAVVATSPNAYGTAFLLARANAIGKGIVGDRVIKLRGGLVVPGTPRLAAVHGDDGSLIADQQDDVAVVGIDPEVLVVVAAGSATKTEPGFSAIRRLHGDGAGHNHDVRILWIDPRDRQISSADAAGGTGIVGDLRPGVARVIGTVHGQFP